MPKDRRGLRGGKATLFVRCAEINFLFFFLIIGQRQGNSSLCRMQITGPINHARFSEVDRHASASARPSESPEATRYLS